MCCCLQSVLNFFGHITSFMCLCVQIQWSFNGMPLVSHGYQTSTEGNVYRLIIRIAVDEDAGRFSIQAENSSGVATCSALLTVAPPLPVRPPPVLGASYFRSSSTDHDKDVRCVAALDRRPVSVEPVCKPVVKKKVASAGVYEQEM